MESNDETNEVVVNWDVYFWSYIGYVAAVIIFMAAVLFYLERKNAVVGKKRDAAQWAMINELRKRARAQDIEYRRNNPYTRSLDVEDYIRKEDVKKRKKNTARKETVSATANKELAPTLKVQPPKVEKEQKAVPSPRGRVSKKDGEARVSPKDPKQRPKSCPAPLVRKVVSTSAPKQRTVRAVRSENELPRPKKGNNSAMLEEMEEILGASSDDSILNKYKEAMAEESARNQKSKGTQVAKTSAKVVSDKKAASKVDQKSTGRQEKKPPPAAIKGAGEALSKQRDAAAKPPVMKEPTAKAQPPLKKDVGESLQNESPKTARD